MSDKAKRLAAIRHSLGWTMSETARRLHTPRGTYVKWENGQRRVPGIALLCLRLLTADEMRGRSQCLK